MKDRRIDINWKAAALGSGVGAVSMVVLCAVSAGMLAGENVGMEAAGYLTAGVLVGSSFLGGLTASGGGPASSAAAALAELAVLFLLNLVLSGGQVEGLAFTALALAGGCGASILLSMNRGRGGKRRRRRGKNR